MNLSKTSLKSSLLIISCISGIILFSTLNSTPGKDSLKQPLEIAGNEIQFPVNLLIPRLNINTTVETVGVSFDGSMDIPKHPDNVAWYDLGPLPGEIGSAVINGHSGYRNNQSAIFDNLSELQKGDEIHVENKEGILQTFVVREIKSYDRKSDTTSIFNSYDSLAHLNLITCSGAWDEVAGTHSDRLVVFADKVSP